MRRNTGTLDRGLPGSALDALRGQAGLEHGLWLLGYTLAFGLLALAAYGRDEGKAHG